MDEREQVKGRGRPSLSDVEKEMKRAEIASIALRLFLEEGFESVSMRRLGKEVGITPMALYRYFQSKLDILTNLWGHIIDLAFETVAAIKGQTPDQRDDLCQVCNAYVGYWRDNPAHYHLVFMSGGVSNSTVRLFVEQQNVIAKFEIFFMYLAELRSEPRESASVKRATDGLITHLHGIMHSLITMQGYSWTDQKTLIEGAVSGSVHVP